MEFPRRTRTRRTKDELGANAPLRTGRTSPQHQDWTTQAELDFIGGLGTFAVYTRVRPSLGTLLQCYLAAMRLRQGWGEIDQGRIRLAVLEALMACGEKIGCFRRTSSR